MRTLIRLLLTSLLLVGCSQSATPLSDSNGQPLDTTGKWLLVNYWATWCKPCRAEIPALNSLHHELSAQIIVLGYNFDQLEDKALQTAANELGIEFPLLSTAAIRQLDLPGVAGIPVTFLINPDGHYHDRLTGEQSRDSLLAVLRANGALRN
ncbi:MAG: TlpA family protein disulfide reductase [Thiopseudomonas sp.]|nr:TlpA family protein disulfide reductase [Thiopseudomonas sp.]